MSATAHTDAEALERLKGRAARCAAALQRWAEGRMAEEIVPALVGELDVMRRLLGEHCDRTVGTMLRRALER